MTLPGARANVSSLAELSTTAIRRAWKLTAAKASAHRFRRPHLRAAALLGTGDRHRDRSHSLNPFPGRG
jgi:hypothetical protein